MSRMKYHREIVDTLLRHHADGEGEVVVEDVAEEMLERHGAAEVNETWLALARVGLGIEVAASWRRMREELEQAGSDLFDGPDDD